MSCKQSSSYLRRAKSEIRYGLSSMDKLRRDSRSDFFNRLKISRNKCVDRFRRIVEDDIDNESVDGLRNNLEDQNAANPINEEVRDLINQIEAKLALLISQIRARDKKHRVVDQQLLCVMCNNNVAGRNNICTECSAELNSEFLA